MTEMSLGLERKFSPFPDFGFNDLMKRAGDMVGQKIREKGDIGKNIQDILANRIPKELLPKTKLVDPKMLALNLEAGQGFSREDAKATSILYAAATGNQVDPGELSTAVDHQIEKANTILPEEQRIHLSDSLSAFSDSLKRGIKRPKPMPGAGSGGAGRKKPGEEHETERERSDTEQRLKLTRGCVTCLLIPLICCGLPIVGGAALKGCEAIGTYLPSGDEDYRAVMGQPGIGDSEKNLYIGSQLNMNDIVNGRQQPDVFDGLVTPEKFNPDDGFSPQEIARARGWTHTLRQRYFSQDKFLQKEFAEDMKSKGYSEESTRKFLDKYDKFLNSIGVQQVSQRVAPRDLAPFKKGTTFYQELRRASYGPVGKNRIKEIRSLRS